jgi:hypothetical protein
VTLQRLGGRITDLQQKLNTTASRVSKVEVAANSSAIPGLQYTPSALRPPTVLEASKLKRLGIAAGRTWFGRGDGSEVRIDSEVPASALSDSLPANRAIVHQRTRIPERLVEEPGASPYGPSKRRKIGRHDEDRYYRASIVDAGSYAIAAERDRVRAARRRTPPRREPTLPAKVGRGNQQQVSFWAQRRGAGGEKR